MKNKIRCYIDFDNVITDTDVCMADYYNEYYRYIDGFKEADGELIYEYSGSDQMPLMKSEDLYPLFKSNFFWENLQIKTDAVKYIKKLCADHRFEVCILTQSATGAKAKKDKFIQKHLSFVPEVIMANFKYFNKNDITDDCIMIDDHEKNLQNPRAYNILMYDRGERGFNQNCDPEFKARSWKDLYDHITSEEFLKKFSKKVVDI